MAPIWRGLSARAVGSFVSSCGDCYYCQTGWPSVCVKQQTFASPGWKFLTPLPTSTTSPMYSWPMIQPVGGNGMRPS